MLPTTPRGQFSSQFQSAVVKKFHSYVQWFHIIYKKAAVVDKSSLVVRVTRAKGKASVDRELNIYVERYKLNEDATKLSYKIMWYSDLVLCTNLLNIEEETSY